MFDFLALSEFGLHSPQVPPRCALRNLYGHVWFHYISHVSSLLIYHYRCSSIAALSTSLVPAAMLFHTGALPPSSSFYTYSLVSSSTGSALTLPRCSRILSTALHLRPYTHHVSSSVRSTVYQLLRHSVLPSIDLPKSLCSHLVRRQQLLFSRSSPQRFGSLQLLTLLSSHSCPPCPSSR